MFEAKMDVLTTRLIKQFAKGNEVQERIFENMKGIFYDKS